MSNYVRYYSVKYIHSYRQHVVQNTVYTNIHRTSYRQGQDVPAAVDLDDVLLRPARLLGEPVVVLLDPGLDEAPGVDIYYRYRCR